jgi:hypothetical protein
LPADQRKEGGELVGQPAVAWLVGRANGGHFLDASLEAISSVYGEAARVGAIATPGQYLRPAEFFLAVEGRVGDDRDWGRFVRMQGLLMEDEIRLARDALSPQTRPFARFHLAMEPEPPNPVAVTEVWKAWPAK